MNKKFDKKKIKNRLFIMIFICMIIAILIFLFMLHKHTPKIIELIENDDIAGIEQYIRGEGRMGRVVLILLQITETVAIFLPAMPVYICAGALYGKIQGILMCYITNIILNMLMFTAARKLKISSLDLPKFGMDQKLEEGLTVKTGHPERMVLIMALIPVIPNGMIPYVSAQTDITLWGFTKALAVGCLPFIVVFVCCGDMLLSEHFKITFPVVILLIMIVLLFVLFKNKITKLILSEDK